MMPDESQQRSVELLADVARAGAEFAHLLGFESKRGNIGSASVRSTLADAMLNFTASVLVMRLVAESGFTTDTVETVGLIPESALPDFTLSVADGTPNN